VPDWSSLPKLHDSDEAERSARRRTHVREVAGRFVQVALERPFSYLIVSACRALTRLILVSTGVTDIKKFIHAYAPIPSASLELPRR
jgi:hypothetical protein